MPYDRGLVFIAPATIFMSTPDTPNPASESAASVPDALVELRGVTCGYGDRIILENIDLVVPRGKLVALMGTSGGGKTTVLRLIGRQLGVMAGQVLMAVTGIAQSLPYHRNGRLRMLGTTGVKRAQATPDVPTIAEQGVPGYEADSWTGVLLPRGTPPDIVAQLQTEVVRITNLPETKERLTAAGFETVGSTSDAFAALIKNDLARLGKVIRDANIRAE